jgi:mono/diheme cytochrome c family protein
MLFKAKKFTVAISLMLLLLSSFGAMQAFADDDEHEGRMPTATNATFQTECSACHMAYPPGMLPAASWKEMMGTLDKHFDTDASLDAATVAEILPFLEQNAAPERKADSGAKPVLRITETRWFKNEHDEISPATWKRDSIKSASNCMACHTGADKGDFDEDSIRIPK